MGFSLLTYNLYCNNAHSRLGNILKTYKPALVCLQEISTKDSNLEAVEQYGYRLADYSPSFMRRGVILGVATFYNPRLFSFESSFSFDLPRSFYELLRFVFNNNRGKRTVLKTSFLQKKTGKKITIYNFHLAPATTTKAKDKRITNTFEDLKLTKKEEHIIIAGDFNYPYGRRNFETLIKKYGLSEATDDIFYTFERKILKLLLVQMKLDYVLFKNIKHLATKKIKVNHSDHFPLISLFQL